jgi:hypothetical protein
LVLRHIFQQKEITATPDVCINLSRKISSPFSVKILSKIASTSDGTSALLQQADPDLMSLKCFIGVFISIFSNFVPDVVCTFWEKSPSLMNKHLNQLIDIIPKLKQLNLFPLSNSLLQLLQLLNLLPIFQKQLFLMCLSTEAKN